jgi:hypothetical protein
MHVINMFGYYVLSYSNSMYKVVWHLAVLINLVLHRNIFLNYYIFFIAISC